MGRESPQLWHTMVEAKKLAYEDRARYIADPAFAKVPVEGLIAKEYARHGIRSNAVAPALIDTEMIKDVPDLTGLVPLGRYGTPQEVADVVAFLCSDHSSFMTGEVVDVNGGFVID
jgi:enoyl-[acyl-carrier-protein] reductase (NADH)